MNYPRKVRRRLTLRRAKQHVKEQGLPRRDLTRLWKFYMENWPKWIPDWWFNDN